MKKLLIVVCAVFLAMGVRAQNPKDPSHWSMKVLPGKGVYELVFSVKLDTTWHLWSLMPGGDGTLIPPSFKFDKGNYELVGPVKESGEVKQEAMEGIDGQVRYYTGKAVFTQTVKAKAKTKITGSFEYQLCNNMMCLPPKTASFEFHIP